MKILLKIFLIFSLGISVFNFSYANSLQDLISWWDNKINVDCATEDCNLKAWTDLVRDSINDIEKDRSARDYIQDVVIYLLYFVSLIALLFIIYSWFNILTAAWDEEKVKKSKTTILQVIIWIIVIWLAYPIVKWIIEVLNAS